MKKNYFITTVITLMFLLSLISIAFAHSQHLFSEEYVGGVSNLGYVLSGGDYTYQQSIMKDGANAWNDISSNVELTLLGSNRKMSIYKTSTPEDGTYGYCAWWDEYWNEVDVGDGIDFSATSIYLYDNQMEDDNFTSLNKRSTATHEVGHALSLAHTNDNTTDEIMDTGKDLPTSPQSEDKWHLRSKWGW